ncbi:hypothetical protein CON84_19995, partial [Bacillus sp. AFS094228]
QAEEAPRPPAESECLEWKSTFPFYKPRKKLSANNYYLVLNKRVLSISNKTKLIGAGVRDSCGKSVSRGDPAGASRGG